MGTASVTCRIPWPTAPVCLLHSLSSGLHLDWTVWAGITSVPRDSKARYPMGISTTKSALKTVSSLKKWKCKIYSKTLVAHLMLYAQHRNWHQAQNIKTTRRNIIICTSCLLIKTKIFSKDFSLSHTFLWGRLKLQNLPNKTVPQSKLADPWFINKNVSLVNKL